jgi:23S rRNA (cytidine1920-2'-O)/16S rRNA (cytidine1409-2'-O)-methyltransferase
MLTSPMGKRRLDLLLVERGLADTREKARALVMAGSVRARGQPVLKPGSLVDEAVPLEVAQRPRYVGRGGDKLEHALDRFDIDVTGLVAADLGASTGGFTDCLLQRGAARVYAIDVGRAQLDYKLRQDPRVVVMEGVNARHLDELPEQVDIITADVSFISLRLVLPAARNLLAPGGSTVALFKPQFEARKEEVSRGGVIKDPLLHATLIGRFAAWCVTNGFRIVGPTASPLLGPAGNREFFFLLKASESTSLGAASE